MRTTNDPKPKRINARFTPKDFERLMTYCKTAGCSVTDALRLAVRSLPVPSQQATEGTAQVAGGQ